MDIEPSLGIAGKRVIIVLDSLELGGSERQALILARHLRDRGGASVQIWGFNSPGGRTEILCRDNNLISRHYPLHPGSTFRSLPRWTFHLWNFARALRRERPDVILPFCTAPNLSCNLIWKLTGAKFCLWNQRDEGRPISPPQEFIASRFSCAYVTNSPEGAAFLRDGLGIQEDRIDLIPNGIELPDSQRHVFSWRKLLNIPTDRFVACMVANLTSVKDHATLIKSWPLVNAEFHHSSKPPLLLLAGRWDNAADSLKRLANSLGLYDSVKFLGAVDDIYGLLHAADLGIFSSYREGCPNGLLECMAAGLAVVATDIPGIRFALGSQESVCFVPPRNPDALAHNIIDLIKDERRRKAIGAANRGRIAQHFSPEIMVEKMVSIFSPHPCHQK